MKNLHTAEKLRRSYSILKKLHTFALVALLLGAILPLLIKNTKSASLIITALFATIFVSLSVWIYNRFTFGKGTEKYFANKDRAKIKSNIFGGILILMTLDFLFFTRASDIGNSLFYIAYLVLAGALLIVSLIKDEIWVWDQANVSFKQGNSNWQLIVFILVIAGLHFILKDLLPTWLSYTISIGLLIFNGAAWVSRKNRLERKRQSRERHYERMRQSTAALTGN